LVLISDTLSKPLDIRVKAVNTSPVDASYFSGIKSAKISINARPGHSVRSGDDLGLGSDLKSLIDKHPLYACSSYSNMIIILRQDNAGDMLLPPARITEHAGNVRLVSLGDTETGRS
jgi:hypothetical protein